LSTSITSTDIVITLYVAIKLSKVGWLVAMRTPLDGRPRGYKLKAGDIAGLLALIERQRERVIGADGGKPAVLCCYERSAASLRRGSAVTSWTLPTCRSTAVPGA
jgi:hypothetical protein